MNGIQDKTAANRKPGRKQKRAKTAVFLIVLLALLAAYVPIASAANSKIVAITFDDGPYAAHTPRLLDGLKSRGVKATFFVLGSVAQYNKDIVRRAFDDGHQIASHTWSHTALSKLSDDQIRSEVSRTASLLTEITGGTEFAVRPPYGDLNSRVSAAINAPIIIWSVDPTNGIYPTSQATMTSRLTSSARDGSIILLHDTNAANVNTALDSIDTLMAQGFEFVTLNELFRIKGVSPKKGSIYYSAANSSFVNYDESMLQQHWAAEPIAFVKDKGLMLGDGAGFGPNRPVTRGVAVAVLWRLTTSGGLTPAGGKAAPPAGSRNESGFVYGFTDVPVGQMFSGAVEWAYVNGISSGTDDGYFGVDDNITREQFHVLLDRYHTIFGLKLPSASSGVMYRDDARISSWARASVAAIRKAGFVSKNDVEICRPGDDMTRAEQAELLMWFIQTTKIKL